MGQKRINKITKKGLLDLIDTVIIQYCYNDFGKIKVLKLILKWDQKKIQTITSSKSHLTGESLEEFLDTLLKFLLIWYKINQIRWFFTSSKFIIKCFNEYPK